MVNVQGKAPIIFLAAFTVRCRVLRQKMVQAPNHMVMQVVRMLPMVPLYKEYIMGIGVFLISCRK